MTVNGIDLYHGNALPDLSTYDFVIHKATQGAAFVDPAYLQRRGIVKAAGKMWGAYLFMSMDAAPYLQVRNFLNVAMIEPGDLVAVDFETDGTWYKHSPQEIANVGAGIMNLLADALPRNRQVIYSDRNDYNTYLALGKVPMGDGWWCAIPGATPTVPAKIWQSSYTNVGNDVAFFDNADAMRQWLTIADNVSAQQFQLIEG